MPDGTTSKKNFLVALNVKKRCEAAGVGLWQCPHFLFVVMGLVIIVAIVATDLVARNYAEPEVAALIVLAVSAILFIIGQVIIHSFENVVEASRLKSEFVSIVSHELRSPLSAVKWSLDLLRSDGLPEKIPDEASSILSSLGEQNEKMIKIVNTMLEVRHAEEKKLVLSPEKISLKSVTEHAIDSLSSFSRAENIKMLLNASSEGIVLADPKKIEFTVTALLENALRYSSGGTEVKIEISDKNEMILWRVSDQGGGIPAGEQKKVFEKFFRSHNVYRYRSGGLGVGLFLSKSFVEGSGGKMGFSSKEGGGSTFWFSLPKDGG